MAKVIGRDTSSEVANSERRRAMDPDVDYEMDQQPREQEYGSRSATGSSSVPDYPNDSETARYDLQIQAVFKRSKSSAYGMPNTMLKRGPMTWIIPIKNLECRCPKIKVNRSYLILGRDLEAPPGYLGIGPRSIVIEWKDDWYRRMKRFQRRARTCA
ncbi:hypothetical protein ACLKA7_011674 [Drosophila subpalustris]